MNFIIRDTPTQETIGLRGCFFKNPRNPIVSFDVMSCLLYFSGRLYDPDRPLLLCSFGMAFYYYNHEEDKDFKTKSQGSKKVSCGSPRQVDILAGQVTFKVYLSNRQGLT